MMHKHEALFELAQELANNTYGFFHSKGPGIGNHATNQYVRTLAEKANRKFGEDYSEKTISGTSALAVDYYFDDEATIVEVAFGLKNPNTEYEKDVLKAVMAKQNGNAVKKLVFFTKPGGKKK
ncbi:hypothetical protein J6I90_06580 [Pseudidiomarina sp. 1APP75-32.1]|uniref:Uncharacterized protein n=1 Tax=Pseudidiomarina terrestris TaxID=2820060 RepID=A0AAW7QYL7_9GAMM|nr:MULTISPECIES: hypothetical protein [unclassified Pseudidiomarina]MDN7124542.1 hypothetical protein [Pseudidiomarina sp. 1APP75-32.1]MDN7129167.1 hypothetical protein [Pseudidiomarina sp. 1APR75-15]